MLNDLFRMYKKIIILIVIVLCAIIFWFYGCHRQQQGGESSQVWEKTEQSETGGYGYHFEADGLTGDVVFGTKGYLVENRTLPVRVNITSQKEDFTGTLKITLPGADGDGISYQVAVDCQKGVPGQVEMEVPFLGNASYFYFEILDSFGTAAFSGKVLTGEENAVETVARDVYIGVLSDQYSSLEYLDGLTLEVENQPFTLQLVQFAAQEFPTRADELSSLSGILIDAFDTSVLSAQQFDCLKSWVTDGGSLFVGTGTEAAKVLPGMEKLLGIKAGDVGEVLYAFSSEMSRAGSARLYSASLLFSEEEAWESLSFSSPGCIYRRDYGEGSLTVSACSLTDNTFRQWTGREDVLWQIFHEELEKEIGGTWVNDTSLWYAKTALYAFMSGRRPNTFYYGVFFIVYLGVLGFFAYYLLRKIKKREYIWGVVPVVAVIFTVSLAFRSEGSSGETGQSFSALRINDAVVGQDDYYLLYQNNEGTETSVDLVSSIENVEPVDYDYRIQDADEFSTRNITENYTVNNTRNGFDIAFEESIPGTSYILKCSGGSAHMDDSSCFVTQIQTEPSYFKGNVKNISDWHFDKVLLIRGRQYAVLEDVDPGETASVDESGVRFWTEYQDGLPSDENESASAENSMVEYLKQRYMLVNEDQDTLLVIGITDDNDFKLLSGDKTISNSLSAFVNRFPLPEEDDSSCIININRYLDEENAESSLRYGLLEKNETKAVYSFDTTKLLWGLFRNRDGFAGSIYAYNYDTQEQEQILPEEDDYMNCWELEPYVSDMNEMTLTFTLPEGNDYGEAPVLSLLTKKVK